MKIIDRSDHIYAFSADLVAVDSVPCGSRICFDAQDALGGQVRTASDVLSGLDFDRVNPATGPLAIDGIVEGDTLVVVIERIEMEERGATVSGPGLGVLPNALDRYVTRILPIVSGNVQFDDLQLPIRPMIGVIGVAPSTGSYPTGTAHRHGGNMDTKEIGMGGRLLLPVSQDGAMLAMGDVHAVMGDGEVCVSGCEVSARITVTVDRIAGRQRGWPILVTEHAVHVIVSLPTIDEALTEATRQSVELLMDACALTTEDAYMLCSLAVDLGVSQLVDPNKTAKATIPSSILPHPIDRWL
jgi:amidase